MKFPFRLLLAITLLPAFAARPRAATPTASFQTLYSFTGGTDGGQPLGGLLFDSAGNLYGTTSSAGAYNNGTAFALSPPSGAGGWALRTLYEFCPIAKCNDGAAPEASMIFGNDGMLYGTTIYGSRGHGTMFKLDPVAGTLKAYKPFDNSTTGYNPAAPLLQGKAGVFYGTLSALGPNGGGSLFSFDTHGGVVTVLHAFAGPDGSTPLAGLVPDAAGLLYGTTALGGIGVGGAGTVFKFDPVAQTLSTLYSFHGQNHSDGGEPQAPIAFDAAGNLYGTTAQIGPRNAGTVFMLAAGTLKEKVLHTFKNGSDGANPMAGDGVLISGTILYGVTYGSLKARPYSYGTAYQIDLTTGIFTTLYQFTGGADGAYPVGGLIADAAGNLYGVTAGGGVTECGLDKTAGCGTVFEISPQ